MWSEAVYFGNLLYFKNIYVPLMAIATTYAVAVYVLTVEQ